MSHYPQERAVSLAAGAPAAAAIPSLDNTYGALFLGTSFGLMLYGLTVHQTYRYLRLYPTDLWLLICMVIAILLLETFHTALTIAACYFHLVSNFFRPETLAIGHWSTRLITPTTGLTIFICQSFYARRVWFVGPRYRYLVGLAVVFMFVVLGEGFTIAATVEGFTLPLSEFHRVSWMVSVVFGFAVLVDILLTGALLAVLLRSRTGFKRTDSGIEALIVYTINTGLLTSIVGLLCFIFAMILPGNLIYIGISIVETKLYANSVLAVLNSRRSLSNRALEGFELTSYESWRRPHTTDETWDVPQDPREHHLDTRISFAPSADAGITSRDSSTARERSGQFGPSVGFGGSKVDEELKTSTLPL